MDGKGKSPLGGIIPWIFWKSRSSEPRKVDRLRNISQRGSLLEVKRLWQVNSRDVSYLCKECWNSFTLGIAVPSARNWEVFY